MTPEYNHELKMDAVPLPCQEYMLDESIKTKQGTTYVPGRQDFDTSGFIREDFY